MKKRRMTTQPPRSIETQRMTGNSMAGNLLATPCERTFYKNFSFDLKEK